MVITTNSGYPLDLNLYQTVKSMSAAARVVRQGGSIIAVAECWDRHTGARRVRQPAACSGQPPGVAGPHRVARICLPGPWEAQVQALVQLRADVYVYSDSLSEEQIRAALLIPCRSIKDTLSELLDRYGPGATVRVLPKGPQTVPYVTKDE